MLNLDLYDNGPVLVLYHLGFKNYAKIKDFILLKKEINTLDELEVKPPWRVLFYADEWEFKSGKMYNFSDDSLVMRNHIIFSNIKYNYKDISKILYSANLSLSLVQINNLESLRIADLALCSLRGSEISKEITKFDFEVLNCNMIY